MNLGEKELEAARQAWKAFNVPSRAAYPPELMDDGVRYMRLSEEEIKGTVRRTMLIKAGNTLHQNLPPDVFEVTALSFGLCWERLK